MASLEHPRDTRVFAGDAFLVDTSDLLLTQAASLGGIDRGGREYSALLDRIRATGAQLLVTGEVIGEYVNRRVKRFYEEAVRAPDQAAIFGTARSSKETMRAFRASVDFATVIDEVDAELAGIYGLCSVLESPVASPAGGARVLQTMERANLDYTDAVLVVAARSKDARILTHDSDFLNPAVDAAVITVLPA